MLKPDLREIRERSARQDGVADSTVKQLLDYITELSEHRDGMERLVDHLIETCPEAHPVIVAFAAEAITPKG